MERCRLVLGFSGANLRGRRGRKDEARDGNHIGAAAASPEGVKMEQHPKEPT